MFRCYEVQAIASTLGRHHQWMRCQCKCEVSVPLFPAGHPISCQMQRLPNRSQLRIERFAPSAWKAERLSSESKKQDGDTHLLMAYACSCFEVSVTLCPARCNVCQIVRNCESYASLPRLGKPSDYRANSDTVTNTFQRCTHVQLLRCAGNC